MNVFLAIAEDRALGEALRAALPEGDLLLCEPGIDPALRRLISTKADAVIVDDAPTLGRKAVARLQQAVPSLPLIVLSSRGDPETLASWTLDGVQAAVVKPFSCEALLNAVQSATAAPPAPAEPRTAAKLEAARTVGASQEMVALRWLGRTSGYIQDPTRLTQSLVDAATDIFDAVRSAVLLEVQGSVRIVASHGIPTTIAGPLRIGFDSGLMRWFEENPCLIDRHINRAAHDAVKQMQVLGARLGAPLLCGGRVYGALLLGEKASGLDYTLEERELLTAVARSASIAFENARLYRDVTRNQNRVETMLAHISAGVVMVGPDKKIALMNKSAERILQVRADELVGRSVQKLGSAFADVALRALEEGKPRLRQGIQDPAIDARLGLSAAPLGHEGVAVIFSRLPEEQMPAEEAGYSPFWEYLASRVAQEIKNPMVAINTFAQLLPQKYDAPDFRQGFSETVQTEIGRINNVVETLFEFARHSRMELKPTDVNETVRSVLRSFEDELAARSIKVDAAFDPETLDAELDPAHFSQAVQNVLQNSIDAMPSGGLLKIATKKYDDHCEVRVSDTGPGIPEQDAMLVFKPFFSTKERGMGLGLTIANRIMKQHRGDLRLLTSPEGGGVFAFYIPSAEKEADADDSGS